MSTLSVDDRVLGLLLGLGDLHRPQVCHGYANCCACADCRERAKNPVPVVAQARQPWEPKAA